VGSIFKAEIFENFILFGYNMDELLRFIFLHIKEDKNGKAKI
jgi:hypothetical protein